MWHRATAARGPRHRQDGFIRLGSGSTKSLLKRSLQLRRAAASRGLQREHLADQCRQLRAHRHPLLRRLPHGRPEGGIAVQKLGREDWMRVRASGQAVRCDAQSVHIIGRARLVVGPGKVTVEPVEAKGLGATVVGSAGRKQLSRERGRPQKVSGAKVQQRRPEVVRAHEDVAALYVSVNAAAGMRRVQSAGHRSHHPHHQARGEGASVSPLIQGHALHPIHDQEGEGACGVLP